MFMLMCCFVMLCMLMLGQKIKMVDIFEWCSCPSGEIYRPLFDHFYSFEPT